MVLELKKWIEVMITTEKVARCFEKQTASRITFVKKQLPGCQLNLTKVCPK
jgi:hypothetical protein